MLTVSLGLLYAFVVIHHGRRSVLHFNATCNPRPAWVIQQLRKALPYDSAPKYLVSDHHTISGCSKMPQAEGSSCRNLRPLRKSSHCPVLADFTIATSGAGPLELTAASPTGRMPTQVTDGVPPHS